MTAPDRSGITDFPLAPKGPSTHETLPVGGSRANLREPGSTWSRAIWSAIRCLRDMMFCWSPIQSMCFPPRTMLTCYASCAAHAAQGTHLLLVDLWMDSGHTQPLAAPLMSGEFLIISGEGQAYGEDDAETWLRETGWHKAERRPLGGPNSVIIAQAI